MSDANGSDTPMSDDDLFLPEMILQDQLVERKSDNKIERNWLIKWKGFPPEENTWEPRDHLEHLPMWQTYEYNRRYGDQHPYAELNYVKQLQKINDIANSMQILNANTTRGSLVTQRMLCEAVNSEKATVLFANAEKKILNTVSQFKPQETLDGILVDHGSQELVKKCIKKFTKYVIKEQIELDTISEASFNRFNHRLVDFMRTAHQTKDYDLLYLASTLLDAVSNNGSIAIDDPKRIHTLFGVMQQYNYKESMDRDPEILDSVLSVVVHKCDIELLIAENVFKPLRILCHPFTSIDSLILIANTISECCNRKSVRKEQMEDILVSLSYLMTYDIAEIVEPVIYAHTLMMINLVQKEEMTLDQMLSLGVRESDQNTVREQLAVRSKRDMLSVMGCIRSKWRIKSDVPFVIRSLCGSYLSPKQQSVQNKIARFVSLMHHPSSKLKERVLLLLSCLIMESPSLIQEHIRYGLMRNIKAIMREHTSSGSGDREVFTRIFMIVSGMIERAQNTEHRVLVMEQNVWIPLIEQLAATQKIDEQQRNHIVKGTNAILRAYEENMESDIDLMDLVREQIGKLRASKLVLESNIDLIRTLCRL